MDLINWKARDIFHNFIPFYRLFYIIYMQVFKMLINFIKMDK